MESAAGRSPQLEAMMSSEVQRKLKVAFVVGAFPKLSETFILDQVTGLLDRGCEVEIFAEVPERKENLHPEAVAYKVMDRTFFADQGIPGQRLVRAIEHGTAMLRRFPRYGGQILRSLNAFRYGKDAVKLRWLHRVLAIDPRKEYDVVHCHFGPNGLKALELQKMGLLRGSIAVAFHGYDISQWLVQHGEACYEELFDKAALVLPISDFWRHRLIELGCPPEKIQVHRMGIDCEAFAFAPPTARKGDEVRLISICRLTEKKGIEYAIEAVAEASKSCKLSYTIVGDGPLRPRLEKRIREAGATANMNIVGWKLRTEVIEMLGNAHALLAPSVSAADGDMEGIPVTIMEAMARGLPVVSTVHSGIPELVIDRVNGYLAPERNAEKLADCLRELALHPERWDEMGSRGREHVEMHFNVNRLNHELVEKFRRLNRADSADQTPNDG
jgi:colanic acid/amylovoran biosynthesis glycosyltransferase